MTMDRIREPCFANSAAVDPTPKRKEIGEKLIYEVVEHYRGSWTLIRRK